jgi:hypothetical protein
MSDPHSTPKTWSKAASAWSDEFFKIRVYQCQSIPHLKRALEYEKANENRGNRLSTLTEQLRKAVNKSSDYEIQEAIEKEASKDAPDKSFIGQLNKELQDRK